MENNKKRKTKFIIITFVLLVIATIFVIIKLNNSPDKEEKKLISYIKEHQYSSIELKCVNISDTNIYIEFKIKNNDKVFVEAVDVKKRIENYINDDEYINYKVNLRFDYDGYHEIRFSNNTNLDTYEKEPYYHSDKNELGYAYINYPKLRNTDFSPLLECDNIKILHYIEPSSKNELSIINQMKALEYVRILIDNNSWNKKEIKEEIQESHPDCIVVVQ